MADINLFNNSLLCLFCNKKICSKEELVLHLQCHNVEKPFLCTECDKRFSYKAALKRHMIVHMKEKIFSCSIVL